VRLRSWQQELQADEDGARLVVEAAAAEPKVGLFAGDDWVYTARGALFFFKCLYLTEAAKTIRDTGKWPIPPSVEERVALRRFADGRATSHDNLIIQKYDSDHPPAWLRLERVHKIIESEIALRRPNDAAREIGRVSDAVFAKFDALFSATAPDLKATISVARELAERVRAGYKPNQADARELADRVTRNREPPPPFELAVPGCWISEENWAETFLCSPPLQEAIEDFLAPESDEPSQTRAAYALAREADPMLATNHQVGLALAALRDGSLTPDVVVALLAMSGDSSARRALADDPIVTNAPHLAPEVLLKAQTFLQSSLDGDRAR
jgi:hypothetical protein